LPLHRVDDDEAPIVVGDLGCLGGGVHVNPLRSLLRLRQDLGHVVVAVQSGGHDVVEPGARHRDHVGLRDQAPVGHQGDLAHAEAFLEVGYRRLQGGLVLGVAGGDVVGDGDAVAGHEQADHDLGPVTSVVAGVAEGFGREANRTTRVALEVGGGEVVAAERQVQVGQFREARVAVGLQRLFLDAQRVEGAVALVERGRDHTLGQRHVGAQPVGDGPTLLGRLDQAVGRQGEHRVAQMTGPAFGTNTGEGVEPET
jgi:hypothetical protein